jgi:predicted RNase H-like HicB family nuclease
MQNKLTAKQKKDVEFMRGSLPKKIEVGISRTSDGGFFAEILNFPGCVTQGESFSELINMINDAVYAYFEIPKKYIKFMPSYLPSPKTVQKMDIFPVVKKDHRTITIPINRREESTC